MSDEVFRIVIAIGVAISAIAMLVQVFVLLGVAKAAKKMEESTAPIVPAIKPVLLKIGPLVEQVTLMAEAIKPVIEKAGPLIEQAKPAIASVKPFLENAKPAVARTTELIAAVKDATAKATLAVERATELMASVRNIVDDSRPKVAEISQESAAIVRTGREQVERLGDLLADATGRARATGADR